MPGRCLLFVVFVLLHCATLLSAMEPVLTELGKVVGASIQRLRKTDENPPRLSIVDVIMAMTGHTQTSAAKDLRKLVEQYPEMATRIDFNYKFKGERGRKSAVADVRGVVEIVMLLTSPCASRLRQEVAQLMVRYVGGDLRIIQEVYEHHGLQEHLQVHAPGDLRCAFRQAANPGSSDRGMSVDVQPNIKHLIGEVGKQLANICREQIQQIHPWDFQRSSSNGNSLVQEGIIIEGTELLALDRDERLVRMTDWLKERVTSQTWERHGHKLKNMFAVTLKKRKREHCREHDQPLYIARVQGEYRIVYTEVADDELMSTVFKDVKRRFCGIVTRDEQAMKSRRRQMRLEDFFKPVDKHADEQDSFKPDAERNSSSAFASDCASDSAAAICHEAAPLTPARLRIATKRGDESVLAIG